MAHELVANLPVFARTLRAAGVAVRASRVPDAVAALDTVGVTRKGDVRDALRTVLLFRHDDFVLFDELFERFWRVWPDGTHGLPQPMHVPARTRSSLRMLTPGLASAARTDSPEP